MTAYFISDLHLDATRPAVADALLHLTDTIPARDDSLYILGDLFEVWLGDDDDNPFNRRIIEGLARASARGVRLILMHGNRDFLLGPEFVRATGASLLEDPSVVECAGRRVLLMHGDSLCTRDTEYMQARTRLRDPAFQREFLARSLAERADFAANARMESKAHTGTATMEIMDVTPEEVVREMDAHGVDLMIHGHTHRPMVHQLSVEGRPAVRIVLGDWGSEGWMVEFDERGYHLHSFPVAASSP